MCIYGKMGGGQLKTYKTFVHVYIYNTVVLDCFKSGQVGGVIVHRYGDLGWAAVWYVHSFFHT